MSTSDDTPSFTIKKRKPPRGASSTRGGISKLSFTDSHEQQGEEQEQAVTEAVEQEGSAVVIRNRLGGGPKNKNNKIGSSSSSSISSSSVRRVNPIILPPTTTNNTLTLTTGTSSGSGIYSKEYLNQLKNSQSNAPPPREEEDELTMSKFPNHHDHDYDYKLLPTDHDIQRAKSRREELRKTTLGDDYISLGTGTVVGFPSGNKKGDSRLIREEDELGDGDEEFSSFTQSNETLPLGKKQNRNAAIKFKNELKEMIDQHEEEDDDQDEEEDDDEEMKRWEESQIRRGGDTNKKTVTSSNPTKKKVYKPTPIPQSRTLPSLSGVSSRLSQSLSTLSSSHLVDSQSLSHFNQELSSLDTQETELKHQVLQTEQKLEWFSQFKNLVENWADFLDEKFPKLEEIEKGYLDLLKEKYEIVEKRRFENDSDDVSLFTGVCLPITKKSLRRRRRQRTRRTEGEDVEMEQAEEEGEEGEDSNPRSVNRTTRRIERQKRYDERDRNNRGEGEEEDLGYFTDSSLSLSQSQDLSLALSSLESSLKSLFKDVLNDDFRDPNLGIRDKFLEWKKLWKEEYEMLFGSLGLVGVWEFWARVEMSNWNPFQVSVLSLSLSLSLS